MIRLLVTSSKYLTTMRRLLFLVCLSLAGCGGLAWDTRVAESADTRFAMMTSIIPGNTTETQATTRWGDPLQKVRDGARVEYIYRSRAGDHRSFVIVTFEYGVAISVRTTESEGCRATFPPRIPGHAGDTPAIVRPIGHCLAFGGQAGAAIPQVEDDRFGPKGGLK